MLSTIPSKLTATLQASPCVRKTQAQLDTPPGFVQQMSKVSNVNKNIMRVPSSSSHENLPASQFKSATTIRSVPNTGEIALPPLFENKADAYFARFNKAYFSQTQSLANLLTDSNKGIRDSYITKKGSIVNTGQIINLESRLREDDLDTKQYSWKLFANDFEGVDDKGKSYIYREYKLLFSHENDSANGIGARVNIPKEEVIDQMRIEQEKVWHQLCQHKGEQQASRAISQYEWRRVGRGLEFTNTKAGTPFFGGIYPKFFNLNLLEEMLKFETTACTFPKVASQGACLAFSAQWLNKILSTKNVTDEALLDTIASLNVKEAAHYQNLYAYTYNDINLAHRQRMESIFPNALSRKENNNMTQAQRDEENRQRKEIYGALKEQQSQLPESLEMIRFSGLAIPSRIDEVNGREVRGDRTYVGTEQLAECIKSLPDQIKVGHAAELTLAGEGGAHATALYRLNANTMVFFDPNYGVFSVPLTELTRFMTNFLAAKYGYMKVDELILVPVEKNPGGNHSNPAFTKKYGYLDLDGLTVPIEKNSKGNDLNSIYAKKLETYTKIQEELNQKNGKQSPKQANTITNKKRLVLPLVLTQYGHTCKPTALANLDFYYADQHKVRNIPLRKNHRNLYEPQLNSSYASAQSLEPLKSIRQMAKEHGSVQGEILQSDIFEKVAQDMGYSTKNLSPANVQEFTNQVAEHLSQGHPLVTFFAVNLHTKTKDGFPGLNPDNEHACLIIGIDPQKNTIDIAHWGKTYFNVPIEKFYASMNVLADKREPEFYRQAAPGNFYPGQGYEKYDLERGRTKSDPWSGSVIQSIEPTEANSGFKNKLFVITPDLSNKRWSNSPQTSSGSANIPNALASTGSEKQNYFLPTQQLSAPIRTETYPVVGQAETTSNTFTNNTLNPGFYSNTQIEQYSTSPVQPTITREHRASRQTASSSPYDAMLAVQAKLLAEFGISITMRSTAPAANESVHPDTIAIWPSQQAGTFGVAIAGKNYRASSIEQAENWIVRYARPEKTQAIYNNSANTVNPTYYPYVDNASAGQRNTSPVQPTVTREHTVSRQTASSSPYDAMLALQTKLLAEFGISITMRSTAPAATESVHPNTIAIWPGQAGTFGVAIAGKNYRASSIEQAQNWIVRYARHGKAHAIYNNSANTVNPTYYPYIDNASAGQRNTSPVQPTITREHRASMQAASSSPYDAMLALQTKLLAEFGISITMRLTAPSANESVHPDSIAIWPSQAGTFGVAIAGKNYRASSIEQAENWMVRYVRPSEIDVS